MWTNSGTTAALFGPRQGLNMGVAPLPARADGTGKASMLTTSGFFISAETSKAQACWQWLTFLGQQPQSALGLPARRSLAESEVYRKQVGDDRAAAYLSCLADAAQPSSFDVLSKEDWLGGGLFWLTQAYGKVLDKKSGVEEALNEAQKLADQYRACMVAAGDYGQKTYEGCLKQTEPSLRKCSVQRGTRREPDCYDRDDERKLWYVDIRMSTRSRSKHLRRIATSSPGGPSTARPPQRRAQITDRVVTLWVKRNASRVI